MLAGASAENRAVRHKERLASMARDLRPERLLLSKEELTLVEKTHSPILEELSDRDLTALLRLVRERRDRTQRIAARQRRELRGKADPKGIRAAIDDTGTKDKRDLLAAAVQRLNGETKRRKGEVAPRRSLVESAQRALELRRASDNKGGHRSPARTVNQAKQLSTPVLKKAPRNPARAGAISQHTKNMQAKRDGK
jgi:hypothetical protein